MLHNFYFRSTLLLLALLAMNASANLASAGLMPAGFGDPNIPDLIYDSGTGEVVLDPDGSSIIGYSIKSASGAFLAGNHTPILGGVSTSLPTELAEAALSSPGSPMSIGFVFPTALDGAGLGVLLSEFVVSRGFGVPLVSFDVYPTIPPVEDIVPEPSTYMMGALGLLGLILLGCRRRRRNRA